MYFILLLHINIYFTYNKNILHFLHTFNRTVIYKRMVYIVTTHGLLCGVNPCDRAFFQNAETSFHL